MKKLAVTKQAIPREIIEKELQQVAQVLIKLTPMYLYLFGSAATKKLTDQSDMDFLLVFKDKETLRMAQKALGPQYPLSEISVDLVWMTRDEFQQKKNLGGVAFEAFNSGELLYEG